jgi:CHAT domain-containing protein/Tfp pilus assembly protein PilF
MRKVSGTHRHSTASWWLVVFLVALGIGEGHGSVSARPHTSQEQLQLDTPLSGTISTEECHLSSVALVSGQFVSLSLEHPGFDARIEILGPYREIRLRYGHCPTSPTNVSLIAESSGDHFLRLCPAGSAPTNTPFTVKISQIRSSLETDEDLIAGERAFAEAEDFQAEYRAEANKEAINRYREALSNWQAAGLKEDESRTLTAIGDVHHTMGELQKAQEHYQQAFNVSDDINDLLGQGRAMNGLASVFTQLGENQKAREYCDQAITRFEKVGDRAGLARSYFLIGDIFGLTGDLTKSLEFYNRSLPLWRELGNRRGQAQTLVGMGYNYSDLGDDLKAIEYYEEAHSLWRTVNDRRGRAQTLLALGYSTSTLGRKQEALNLFHLARELAEPMGDDVVSAKLANSLGRVYRELHQYQEALEYYKLALGLFQGAGSRRAEGDCLFNVSRCYLALGNAFEAETFCSRALDIYRSLPDPRNASLALRELGNIHVQLGDRKTAASHYQQALALNRETKSRREEAYTLNSIGRLYHELGEQEKALEYYDKALPISRETADPAAEALTQYNIARVNNVLAEPEDALSRIEAAIDIIDSLRSKVASHDLRTSYFASLHGYHVLHIDLLMQMHQKQPSGEWASRAFQASEHARARSLLDSLSEAQVDIRRGVDPDLLERERSLQRELNTKAERQMQLMSGGTDEESVAIAKEIQKLTTEYEQLQSLIRSKSPRHAALTQPQPLSLEAIQREVLDDETLLLEYALGEERSFLWAATDKTFTSYELPPRAKIEESARTVYELLTARQPRPGDDVLAHRTRVKEAGARYWQEAAQLSEMVLGPVAGQLKDQRLLVVSDGLLQYLPFGALPVPGPDGSFDEPVPLVVEHELVNMPSASTLAVLRKETAGREAAGKAVAVLADPVFEHDDPRLDGEGLGGDSDKVRVGKQVAPSVVSDLHRSLRDIGFIQEGRLLIPRLPSTRREAEAIIAAAPPDAGFEATGFRASRETAIDPMLADYRIVHFATHGLLNNEHPELSGIILSMVDENGRSQNGFLRLHDIYNLNLPVEMVVLSACNSGLGKNVQGEGLVGIVRGFMYAGAERVVASLWKVDDEATGDLMKIFYKEMLEKDATPAAALRKAQIDMWQNEQWRSPFYWAAFVLQGEWM